MMPADVEKIIIIISRCFPREPAPFPGRFPFARAVLLSVVFLVCFFPVFFRAWLQISFSLNSDSRSFFRRPLLPAWGCRLSACRPSSLEGQFFYST
jgi:hypothetical protein